jgi:hypothetical protein
MAERLAEANGARLLTTDQVAAQLGVKPASVRRRADELGVIRLGDGARPRLRFEQAKVDAYLARKGRG